MIQSSIEPSINLSMSHSHNLGDALSFSLYSKISSVKINLRHFNYTEETSYLTTGSVLRMSNENNIIMGTGFISEDDDVGKGDWSGFTDTVCKTPKKIISVRGPLTRKKLMRMGVPCPENYGDPSIIFPLAYEKYKSIEPYDVGLIPHYADKNSAHYLAFKKLIDKKYKAHEINIMTKKNYNEFLSQILMSKVIVSSSLHGIIFGLIYGKKTIFTEFSQDVFGNKFKFYDFFNSLDIDYQVLEPTNNDILDNYIKMDTNDLHRVGENIIASIPFIPPSKKNHLTRQWAKHIDKTFQC